LSKNNYKKVSTTIISTPITCWQIDWNDVEFGDSSPMALLGRNKKLIIKTRHQKKAIEKVALFIFFCWLIKRLSCSCIRQVMLIQPERIFKYTNSILKY